MPRGRGYVLGMGLSICEIRRGGCGRADARMTDWRTVSCYSWCGTPANASRSRVIDVLGTVSSPHTVALSMIGERLVLKAAFECREGYWRGRMSILLTVNKHTSST